jgi:hypothetical protein
MCGGCVSRPEGQEREARADAAFQDHRSGFYIPVVDSSQGEPKFKCTVITGVDDGENRYCGKAFHDPHSFERHTIKCSEEHMGAIREAAPSQRLGALSPQNQTDWEDWLDAEDAWRHVESPQGDRGPQEVRGHNGVRGALPPIAPRSAVTAASACLAARANRTGLHLGVEGLAPLTGEHGGLPWPLPIRGPQRCRLRRLPW